MPGLFEQQDHEEQIKTDFDHFYDNNLQPFLQQLAAEAQSYKNWKYYTIATALLAFIFLALYQFLKIQSAIIPGLVLLPVTAIGVYFTTKMNEKFIDDFKEKIISRIIHHISPAAVYKPMQYLSKKDYLLSGLFLRRFTGYEGGDYWKAAYRGVDFHCSELMVRYEDSAVATTIFKGLFIEAIISAHYADGTYVWTKGAAQLPASMADASYRMYPLPGIQKFPVEDGHFNHSFTVYSSVFTETGKLLTPKLRQQMLLLKEKTGRDIVFSFVSGKCFVAIPMEEDLLEPTVAGLRDKESYKKYFFTFLLVFNIIKELELDRLR